MPYATGRTFLDADSHIMERPDFIRDFADAKIRDQLPPLDGGNQGKTSAAWSEVVAQPGHTPERVAELVQLGDELIQGPKGYQALGAFNASERTQALNQLGFERQLVFSTFSPGQTLHLPDIELKYGAAQAHNRAMADFCNHDPRLMGVGTLPLDDPQRAMAETEHLIELGLSAAWVAHHDCGGSFTRSQ